MYKKNVNNIFKLINIFVIVFGYTNAFGQFHKPIDSYPNTGNYREFGYNVDSQIHLGTDFKTDEGDPVYSILDGEVLYSGEYCGFGALNIPKNNSNCGKNKTSLPGGAIVIRHKNMNGDEFYAIYGHIIIAQQIQPNTKVQKGDVIGSIRQFFNGTDKNGNFVEMNHLHFGIFTSHPFPISNWGYYTHKTNWVDPVSYLLDYCSSSTSNTNTSIINDMNVDIFHVDASKAPHQVKLYCSVTDKNSNFVENLAPPYNFNYKSVWQKLIEIINQKEFGIDKFSVEEFRSKDSPAFISSLVMDYSGSMVNDINNVEFALSKVKNHVRKNKDEFNIVQFDNNIYTSVQTSSNPNDFDNIMPYSQLGGFTAFYDACIQGISNIANSSKHKVAILFTDGLDNRSNVNANEVVALARQNNCRVFVIGLGAADTKVYLRILWLNKQMVKHILELNPMNLTKYSRKYIILCSHTMLSLTLQKRK